MKYRLELFQAMQAFLDGERGWWIPDFATLGPALHVA
jgi:hypothetical protein